MEVFINGLTKEVSPDLKLLQLIKKFKINPQNLIIQINEKVIKKEEYSQILIQNKDKIELVQFIGGG